MEKLFLGEIAVAIGGRILFGNEDVYCESVVMDSRKVTENTLFIGIKGEQVDGNDYFLAAFEQGASIALIEKDVDVIPSVHKGLIRVESTRALTERGRDRLPDEHHQSSPSPLEGEVDSATMMQWLLQFLGMLPVGPAVR